MSCHILISFSRQQIKTNHFTVRPKHANLRFIRRALYTASSRANFTFILSVFYQHIACLDSFCLSLETFMSILSSWQFLSVVGNIHVNTVILTVFFCHWKHSCQYCHLDSFCPSLLTFMSILSSWQFLSVIANIHVNTVILTVFVCHWKHSCQYCHLDSFFSVIGNIHVNTVILTVFFCHWKHSCQYCHLDSFFCHWKHSCQYCHLDSFCLSLETFMSILSSWQFLSVVGNTHVNTVILTVFVCHWKHSCQYCHLDSFCLSLETFMSILSSWQFLSVIGNIHVNTVILILCCLTLRMVCKGRNMQEDHRYIRNDYLLSIVQCVALNTVSQSTAWTLRYMSETRFVCLTSCTIRQLTGGKSNQQMHWNCVSLLKIYLFIVTTRFGYFLAIIRVLVIWYSGINNVYIFRDTVIYIRVLQFQCTMW
jgi:hypothetical protein